MRDQPLTPRQADVLNFIRRHIKRRGFPPSFREIADFLGSESTNAASYHLNILEMKGWIKRVPGLSRGIRVMR